MSRDAIDLFLTEDGDIATSNGDLKTVSGNSFKEQSAMNRIKSIKSDWFFDGIGADMEEILGEPNTREIAEKGKGKLIQCLTEDDFFNPDEVWVKVAPLGKNDILYIVAIKSEQGAPIVLNVKLDLVKGVYIV
jgi:hypothetical protein